MYYGVMLCFFEEVCWGWGRRGNWVGGRSGIRVGIRWLGNG